MYLPMNKFIWLTDVSMYDQTQNQRIVRMPKVNIKFAKFEKDFHLLL